ncbi:dienelactone hydrolase family protein [Acidiferrimicrobium sp. IK]|uniref:dienelactone hydrolase family protein n=1 Tax=Acidiferrimicrobium sp. IK TaxID=2871700 RepID=UPI0021CB7513|nr:dienelactone hydrolase family protein [Acidiferrimicrobium sp. IK]MCU4184910.1 dienelactone hydrolase family protein [Acidiferrimicrobium sp. IK]
MPDNPQQNVTFPSNGGEAHGYLAVPPSGSGPGVIVIQEWWGLTSHIVSIADRLAREGFVALAPDLYGGATTHDADEAGALMQALPLDRAARDLAGAVGFLLSQPQTTSSTVGAVGFCMGGRFVLTLAAQQGEKVSAAVPFYPVGPDLPDLSGIKAAVQMHVGGSDAFIPVEASRGIADKVAGEASVTPEFHEYPAGHAFLNDENLLGTYDSEQAAVAWGRMVEFLKQHVR